MGGVSSEDREERICALLGKIQERKKKIDGSELDIDRRDEVVYEGTVVGGIVESCRDKTRLVCGRENNLLMREKILKKSLWYEQFLNKIRRFPDVVYGYVESFSRIFW